MRAYKYTTVEVLTLITAGEKTAREICEILSIDILTVRKHTRKLVAMMLVEAIKKKRETNYGRPTFIYRRLPINEAVKLSPESDDFCGPLRTFLRLCARPSSRSELREFFRASQVSIGRHVSVLHERGLVYVDHYKTNSGKGGHPIEVLAAQRGAGEQMAPNAEKGPTGIRPPKKKARDEDDDWQDPLPRLSYPATGVIRHHLVG